MEGSRNLIITNTNTSIISVIAIIRLFISTIINLIIFPSIIDSYQFISHLIFIVIVIHLALKFITFKEFSHLIHPCQLQSTLLFIALHLH